VSDKDQRTEKPTPKRRKEARKNGQIPKSADIGGWTVMLASTLMIPTIFSSGEKKLTGLVNQASNVMTAPTSQGAITVLESGLKDMLALVLPLVALFARKRIPFGGGILFGRLAAGLRHCRCPRREFDCIFGARQPDLLATGTPHCAASRAQCSWINGIGRRTMRANDVHGS